jgi:hypothetical protein
MLSGLVLSWVRSCRVWLSGGFEVGVSKVLCKKSKFAWFLVHSFEIRPKKSKFSRKYSKFAQSCRIRLLFGIFRMKLDGMYRPMHIQSSKSIPGGYEQDFLDLFVGEY